MSEVGLQIDPLSYLRGCTEPWIVYKLVEHLKKPTEHVLSILVQNEKITEIIDECKTWPGEPIKRHNDTTHLFHKIEFLADLGLTVEIEGIREVADRVLAHQSEEGMFLSSIIVPKVWGGYDKPSMDWMLCDAPVHLYSLLSFGVSNEQTDEAARNLVWLVENNGWRCINSLEKFRGPGRKEDFCPYANLIALKALSLHPKYRKSESCELGIDAQLMH
ncbi:MAG: hypothetical protein NWE89_12690 [Candidatus Bathyarchaeota archaeon]|nr:hypothetical protein [Candidatus Bathyarchaeota archaeon]